MASYNRVVLLGNLTRDVEMRYTPSGTAVADIGLAVNDYRKSKDGTNMDTVVFVDVTLWARTAEIAAEYLKKGSPVLIEGRLQLDQWESPDGEKRSKLKVVGEKLQLLGTKDGGRTANAGKSTASQVVAPPGDDDEDVPF